MEVSASGPESPSCIKPSAVKAQGWATIRSVFNPNQQNAQGVWSPPNSPIPPPPPLPPPAFPGFVDTVGRVMADKCHFQHKYNKQNAQPKDVDDATFGLGKVTFGEMMAKTLKADSDSLLMGPQRAFDFASQPGGLRSRPTRRLPPRATEYELQRDQLQSSHKTHFAKTGEFLYHLYEHDQLTDVIVHCGTYTFSAHAVTLACHSSFFCRSLLDNKNYADNHRHVDLSPEVSPTAFHVLLDYMYTGELQIDPENMAELLSASLTLGMDAVGGRCDAEMDNLSPENVLVVWEMAERNNLHAIAAKAIKIIGRNFHVVVKSLPFLSLDFERLTQLLQRDDLPVRSESDVSEAAIAWLCHDEVDRYPYLARVLSCVRLPLMTSEELFSIVNKIEFLFENQDVQQMFMAANWFATARRLLLPCGLNATLPRERNDIVPMASNPNDEPTKLTKQHFRTEEISSYRPDDKAPIMSQPNDEPIKLAKENFRADQTTSHETKAIPESKKNGSKPNRVTFIDPTLDDEDSSCSELSDTCCGSDEMVRSVPPVTVRRLMLLGGYDPLGHEIDNRANVTMTYNRAGHMWMSHVDMPEPRAHHATVVVSDMIYVIGGSDPSMSSQGSLVPQSTVFAFVIKEGKWRQRASLCTPRTRHRACVIDDNIYVIGGRDENGVLSSVERYDKDLDSWENLTSMTCPRLGAGVAAYHQQVVIAGGYGPSTNGNHSILSSVEFITPSTGSSMLKTPLRTPRCHGSLVQSGELLYLCGGLQPTGVAGNKFTTISMAAIDIYNEETDTWSMLTEMAVPRHQVAAAAMDGKLYVVGGMSTKTSTTSDSMECYDIVSGTWEKDVKPLPRPLMGCEIVAVTLLF